MNSLKLSIRRAGSIGSAFALILALAIPTFVAADQVAERSIELSSSAKSATGVSYKINFTSVGAGGAFIVDFCSDSPLIGQTCTAPTGFSVSSATTATAGWTRTVVDANTLRLTGTIAATTPISVTVDNVSNPTVNGALYARIITYDTDSNAQTYTSATSLGSGREDEGGVALSITDKISVSGAVLESMTFCVSGEAVEILEEGCVGDLTAPTLTLGETVGTTVALSSSAISTGHVWTQISTNAVGGAIVSIKNNNNCGGLKRFGASGCDIAPALAAGFNTAGQAKFGVKLATAINAGSGTNSNGTYQPASASGYDTTDYKLDFPSGNGSGVSSTYGDPLLDTNNAPVNNKVMDLTFGASISNNTPAGNYTADLSLIATGKF